MAYGVHLDLPPAAVTAYAGTRHLIGFNDLVDGGLEPAGTVSVHRPVRA
ncbi:hypothetical protein [Aeromicrobium wangtongii]|nr:hypothetical protein [Aeromicrobium wangtongii]MCL3819294.1 hypothetical protein [Aeromicrobium wangtongii]